MRKPLLLLLALLLFWARSAAAQTPAGGYGLVVESDPEGAVDFERLRALLSADLGAPVSPSGGKVTVTVRYRDRKLTVRADHGDGRVLERTIEAEEATAEREASLLASNLARDEARELLDDLEARRRPPPSPPPATSEPRRSEKEPPNVFASTALFYPLATNWSEPEARAYVDFTLLFGRNGSVHGAHIGSFAHHVSGEVVGAQIDGFAGVTKDLRGAQLAGFSTITRDQAQGVQVAGAVTYAGEIDGVQVAPVTIAHDVNGVQLGAVNIGSHVKGAQVGAINIADEVDGVQLGAVSINRDGVHPIAFASNLAYTNIGVKFSTRYLYTTLALVYGTLESDFEQLATTGALGGHLPLDPFFGFDRLLPGLDVEAESVITHVVPKKGTDIDDNLWLGGRATAGYSFAKHLRVFAGGGARFPLIVNRGREVPRPELLAGVQF